MEIPLGAVVTAIAALIAVFIASQLNFRRATKERLWDLRRQAYGVILSRLARVERILANADEVIGMVGEEAYVQSDMSDKDNEKILEHMTVVNDRFAEDYLIISDEFIRTFEEFQSKLNSGDPNVAREEEGDLFRDTVKKYRPVLLEQARRETKI